MFRGMLDAKAYDWSFYFLAAIAVVIQTLPGAEDEPAPASSSAEPAGPVTVRPAVYGRRS